MAMMLKQAGRSRSRSTHGAFGVNRAAATYPQYEPASHYIPPYYPYYAMPQPAREQDGQIPPPVPHYRTYYDPAMGGQMGDMMGAAAPTFTSAMPPAAPAAPAPGPGEQSGASANASADAAAGSEAEEESAGGAGVGGGVKFTAADDIVMLKRGASN